MLVSFWPIDFNLCPGLPPPIPSQHCGTASHCRRYNQYQRHRSKEFLKLLIILQLPWEWAYEERDLRKAPGISASCNCNVFQLTNGRLHQATAKILFTSVKWNEISIQVMYIKPFKIIEHLFIAHSYTSFTSFIPQWMLLTLTHCRLGSLISTYSFLGRGVRSESRCH